MFANVKFVDKECYKDDRLRVIRSKRNYTPKCI